MAISFPSNPALGQTYSSGSSATYQWNGTYWDTITPTTQVLATARTASLALTASYIVTAQTSSYFFTASVSTASYVAVAQTASYVGTAGYRKNITKVTQNGYNQFLWIADGKLYTSKGYQGNQNNISPQSSYAAAANAFGNGLKETWEVYFPNTETGNLIDADSFGTSAYALFSTGNLYTWGTNSTGQLGLGDYTDRYIPTLSATLVAKVFPVNPSNGHRSTTYQRLFHQRTDGRVYGTGYNLFGQLGVGDSTNRTSWTEITAIGLNPKSLWNLGGYTGATFVQKQDNTILVCGYNGYGQLGLNNTTNQLSFTSASLWNGGDSTMVIQDIEGGFGYNDTANQVEHVNLTMFLDNGTTSRIASAGANNWGTIGDGTTIGRQVPTVPTVFSGRVSKIVRIGDGPGAMWVLKTDGTVWSWGYNNNGQGGNGTFNDILTPGQRTSGASDIINQHCAGYVLGYRSQSPIVVISGSYFSCGYNLHGYLGVGDLTDKSTLTKMLVPRNTVIKSIGTCNNTSYAGPKVAVTTDNRVLVWGYNELNGITIDHSQNYPMPLEMTIPIFNR